MSIVSRTSHPHLKALISLIESSVLLPPRHKVDVRPLGSSIDLDAADESASELSLREVLVLTGLLYDPSDDDRDFDRLIKTPAGQFVYALAAMP